MIDPSLKALMNEAADGTLDESQEREFRRRLAAQPEAQAFFDGLVRVRAMLDTVPLVDPPAALRAGIMRAIESEAKSRAPAEPTERWTRWRLIAAGPPRPRWGYALVFAAGLIIGFLPFIGRSGWVGSGPEHRGLVGTLTSNTGDAPSILVAQSEISLGPVQGHAEVSRAAQRLTVDLDLLTTGETDLSVEFKPTGYRLMGFEQHGEDAGEMEIAPGEIRVTSFTGGRLRITLEEKPSVTNPPLRLVARRGEDVFEQAIEVHGDSR